MNKLSIKVRITLWYLLAMLIVSGIALSVNTAISKKIITRDVEERITRTVSEFSMRHFAPKTGKKPTEPEKAPENNKEPEPTPPLPMRGLYEQGVHMLLFDMDNNLLAGEIPFELSSIKDFEEEKLVEFSEDSEKYYMYAKKVTSPDGNTIWAVGIASITNEAYAINSAFKTNIILTLALLLLATVGGYLILLKAFAPVKKITNTAKEIAKSSDLSQRINLGNGHDEIYNLANTFDEMIAKIEDTMEREKQFTSDASHELRTPVSVILSECEYMTDCAKDFDEMKESAVSVKNQANKMSKLIQELLTISRMDKNTLQTSFEEVDFSELLEFVCDEQEEIHDNNITLIRDIKKDIICNCDRSLIARLCINLISNAYSYGRDNGTIKVTLSADDKAVKLSVKDDGIGIPQDKIDKIWERFYQVDPSRTANDEGNMGLGLSMVSWIARVHNGEMKVASELEKGSEFIFTMPI